MDDELGDSPELTVSPEDAGQRLDRFLARHFPGFSRTRLQRMILTGAATINGSAANPSRPLREGDRIRLAEPEIEAATLEPENIPLSIVYEDDDLVVVDKPAGLVVHPGAGHPSGTLVNALLARYPHLAVGGGLRPGLVHRLDKDTSGLMVVAKTDRGMASLTAQMQERTVLKEYIALVWGRPDSSRGIVDAPIGRDTADRRRMVIDEAGRSARTHFEVLATYSLGGSQEMTLLRLRLETGRTHQIRVHLAAIGLPVVGDPRYGRHEGPGALSRQFLHASRLGFKLPSGEYREFTSPLPPDLREFLGKVCSASQQS